LDENPIWLNEAQGISIKRVTIYGVSNAQSLHDKRDKEGRLILDERGNRIPVDFVNTSNNHHVAIYQKPVLDKKGQPVLDEDGMPRMELDERVVSFYEVVARINQGLPAVDKEYKRDEGWSFLYTMKQNEYFVFPNEATGFDPKEIDLLDPNNYAMISPNLFRVQTISKVMYGNSAVRDYKFRHHLETTVVDVKELKDLTYKQYKSLAFTERIVKVRINHIGQIVAVGEY
jgi:CRISPR-associated endonuclease Csn1